MSTLELHLPQSVVHTRHIGYYAAVGAVLFVVWLLQPRKQKTVDVPFYSASRTGWIFDAENLILDSYKKVSTLHPKVLRIISFLHMG